MAKDSNSEGSIDFDDLFSDSNDFDELFASPDSPSQEQGNNEDRARRNARAASHRNIDPVEAAREIETSYKRYLTTLMSPNDPRVAKAFTKIIEDSDGFAKGPYLQLTPPYAPGKSPRQLIDEGILCESFSSLENAIPLDRSLYAHQEEALRKINNHRNVVVSTGTGSGKTESFLVPIINSLLKEKEAGTLGPGVRALLLYPMNALANDQVKRLRELLADVPEITFGRYTGETKQGKDQAEDSFRSMNGTEAKRLKNELLSRDEMQATPPNILLTNYAMLEYLLLRPRDTSLFDGARADSWQFIVIDEAHVYAGAQGTEVAMLLRRLKDRVAQNRPLQCIATSASLQGENTDITTFGSTLFGEPFEWHEDDQLRQDIVFAQKLSRPQEGTWNLTDDLLTHPDRDRSLAAMEEAVTRQAEKAGAEQSDYQAIVEETHLVELREKLANHSRSLDVLGKEIFPHLDAKTGMEAVHRLVLLGSSITDTSGVPAFSARYHMFVRAAEGAYLGFHADGTPEVSLDRKIFIDGTTRPMFELGTCKRCGSIHFSAIEQDGRLVPPDDSQKRMLDKATNGKGTEAGWVLYRSTESSLELDEDDSEVLPENNTEPERHHCCMGCGRLMSIHANHCGTAGCEGGPVITVQVLSKRETKQLTCFACGTKQQNLIRRLITTVNAGPAVLATSLYQLLPPADDDQNFNVGGGRKLLTFSDSRQSAAYAAPYLETTYSRLLERRAIFEALKNDEFERPNNLARLAKRIGNVVNEHHIFEESASSQTLDEETQRWLWADIAGVSTNNTLEDMGLIHIHVDEEAIRRLSVFEPLKKILGSDKEASALLNLMARDLRVLGAMSAPDNTLYNDSRFEPRTGQNTFKESGGRDNVRRVYSWLPARGTNNRFELVKKVLERSNVSGDPRRNAEKLLSRIWQSFQATGLLTKPFEQAAGVALDHTAIRVSQAKSTDWYQCTKCRTVTPFNVGNLCSHGWCSGTLEIADFQSAEFADHHYRTLAQEMRIYSLHAQEHTAQWTPHQAATVQDEFIKGRTNVLSCSTTFELGVDVGDLQSVLLRNVPPRTANYVQRAGRAGRRAGSAAFVLTFAKRAAHDLATFADPVSMIDGEMPTPFLQIENPRIVERHMYSVAFAAFLRFSATKDNPKEWNKVGEFLLASDAKDSGLPYLENYVQTLPSEVSDALKRIVPSNLQDELEVEGNGWVSKYLDLWHRVNELFLADYEALRTQQEELLNKKEGRRADAYGRTLQTLEKQQLFAFMAKRNLLPKYGFPVDTVELQTNLSDHGASVQLSRDLQLAITDYAPGAQVVAGGRVWASTGIRQLPGKDLLTYYWVRCDICEHIESKLFEFQPGEKCSQCGAELPGAEAGKQRKFIIPEFGFVADVKSKPVTVQPTSQKYTRSEFVKTFGSDEGTIRYEYTKSNGRPIKVELSAWSKTDMAVLNTGPIADRGYRYCQSCGWADPAPTRKSVHSNPRNQRDCHGYVQDMSLGHIYQTDIVTIAVPTEMTSDVSFWRSSLYALVESASQALEINRDDVGATLAYLKGRPVMVLFDAVPGGAGITKQILTNFPQVVKSAIKRVSNCDCGADTSCYGCLRSYSNQRFHEQLRRDNALSLLASVNEAIMNGTATSVRK